MVLKNLHFTLRLDGKDAAAFDAVSDFELLPVALPAGAKKAEIFCQIPLIDVHEEWVTSLLPGPLDRLPWRLEHPCGAHQNFPYIALFNRSNVLRAGLGTTDLIDDCRIISQLNQEKCTADITFEIAVPAGGRKFSFFCDRRAVPWQQSVAAWRKALALPQYGYPAHASDPVFCTWYAVHGAVSEKWVEEQIPLMKQLGLSTLIIDDGWCYDVAKRVSPQTITTWYEWVGDWKVSEKKFPDFRQHVAKVQAQGISYMVWVAPHLIGAKSDVYKNHPEWCYDRYVEGYYQLNIHNAEAKRFYVERLRSLAKENRLDGLKIDFLDIVPPDADAPMAVETDQFIRSVTDALKEDNPDALIEFRQRYSTPATLGYGTQFRAGDAPFDWKLNFGRLVELRLALGNLAPVHADPAYWAPGETDENVARHMIAMLVGVPMLSVDLTKLSEREQKIIRYWIGVYNAHRALINHGEWRFEFFWKSITAAIVENETERMIILDNGAELPKLLKKDGKRTLICNLSDAELTIPGGAAAMPDGEPGEPGKLLPGGSILC